MRKLFSIVAIFLLVLLMTACRKNRAEENGTAGSAETSPATDIIESANETGTATNHTGSASAAEGIQKSCLAIL